MNNASRPPSPSRFHRLAQEIQRGEIYDYDLLYLCESNPFYQTQLDALLRAPAEAVENAKQQQEQARIEALRQLRHRLRRTCVRRRAYLSDRAYTHRNTLPRYLRLRRNQVEKQGKWNAFLMDLKMYRISQAMSWIDRRHSEWISNVIFESANPFELVDAWPLHSACSIDPVMSPTWVPLVPPIQATVIPVEKTRAQRMQAIKRHYLQLQEHDRAVLATESTDQDHIIQKTG